MKKIVVSKDSSVCYINDAIKMADENGTIIKIKKGIYNEKVIINKPNILLKGEEDVVITFNDYSRKIHSDGRDYNTFRTPSVTILGDNCKMENITIINNCKSSTCGQAVALAIYGNNFKAKNCTLISEQDTLFLGPLPDDLKERYFDFLSRNELFIEGSLYSKFESCTIEGNIDFIFGSGSSLFANCNLISNGSGYVIAPAHSMYQNDGFNFIDCNFIKKDGKINNVYIARPWRAFGKINILNCKFESHILEIGYTFWNNPHPEIYHRFYEYPLLANRNELIHTYNNEDFKSLIDELNLKFNF